MKLYFKNNVVNREIANDMKLYLTLKKQVNEIDNAVFNFAMASRLNPCKPYVERILLLMHSKDLKLLKMIKIRNLLKQVDTKDLNLVASWFIFGKSDREVSELFKISKRSLYRLFTKIDQSYKEIKHGKKHLFK